MSRRDKQNEFEKARRNASLVTVLLPHLASQDDKQSRLAIAVTRFLREKGELPGELDSALVEIVQGGNLQNAAPGEQAKVNAAAAVIDIPPSSGQENRADVASLPPRVYIQVPGETQRPLAQSLQSKLRASGFIVPGIENIGGKAIVPEQTEIRYYRDEEKGEASRVITILKDAGVQVKDEPQKIPGKGGGTRPRHYELWISRS